MPHLSDVPLSGVEVFPSISKSAIGDFLQVAAPLHQGAPPTIFVGLRCELSWGAIQPGLVVLEGPSAGIFLSDEELRFAAAVNISKLAHIILHDPLPEVRKAVAGDACSVTLTDGQSLLAIAMSLPAPRNVIGYVRLEMPDRGKIEKAVDSGLFLGRLLVQPVG